MSDTTANVVVNVVDRASGILGGIGKALGSLALAAGAAALTAGFAAVKLASDFEATMNDFKMAAGDNLNAAGLSADDFTKKFLQLGKDTKYSSKQAAEAGVELVKAGMDIKSVMGDATEATLNLAAAAKSELAPTARIVAQQVQTWADQGANATDTSNMLAQALNASTITTLDDLALGLANVNGVAKASGVTQSDVVLAMAATSKNFASASDQGTAFKSMLQALAGPSKDAKGSMRELGLLTFDYAKAQQYLAKQGIKTDGSARQINVALEKLTKKFKMSKKDAQEFFNSFEQNQFYDAEGKFKGMGNAAEILKKSLEGLSDEAKAQALKDIFGSDGVRFAAALAEQGANGLTNMAAAMKKAGTAAEQAAKLNQGLGFVIESVKGSIESVAIAFGLKFLPVLTAVAETVILPLVNSFGDWIDTLDFTGISVEGLRATVAGVMPQIKAAVSNAFTAMGPIIETAKNVFWSLVDAAMWIYNTVVTNWPTISAIATSVFNTIATTVGTWWATVSPVFMQVGGAIMTGVGQAITWLSANWPQISTIIGQVFTAVVTFVQGTLIPIIGRIISTFATVVSWVVANWPQISATISSVFAGVSGFIQGTLIPIINTVISAFSTAVAWVITNWPQIKNTISAVINGAVMIFNTVLMPQIQWLIDQFQEVVTWVSSNWPLIVKTFEDGMPMWKTILGALGLVFVTAWEAIKLVIGSAITLILGVMKTGMQLMQGDTSGALETIRETFEKIFKKVVDAVKVPIGLIVTFLKEKFNEIKSHLAEQVAIFYNLGKNIVTGLLNSIIDFGDKVKDKIIEMIMGPLGYVKGLLGIHSPSDEMYWVGQMIGEGLANGIQDSIGAVTDAMKAMHTSMMGAFAAPDMQFASDAGAALGTIFGGDSGDGGVTGAVADALAAIGANPPGNDPASHADEAPTIHIGSVNVNNQSDADYLVSQLRDKLLRR